MINEDQILDHIEIYRNQNKKIVLTNGVFDILHVGHLRSLEEAKSYGDILIVCINSDDSARKLKGAGRPITTEEERAEMLLGLYCVDYVIIFDEPNAESYIELIKPDFYAKGHDYTVDTVPEKQLVESYGGKVIITGDTKNHSTTEIIKKLYEL